MQPAKPLPAAVKPRKYGNQNTAVSRGRKRSVAAFAKTTEPQNCGAVKSTVNTSWLQTETTLVVARKPAISRRRHAVTGIMVRVCSDDGKLGESVRRFARLLLCRLERCPGWQIHPAIEEKPWHRRPAGDTQARRLCHVATYVCGPSPSDVPWPPPSQRRAAFQPLPIKRPVTRSSVIVVLSVEKLVQTASTYGLLVSDSEA